MSKDIGTFLAGVVILAGIFVMVRPGSQGPKLVSNVTGGLSNLIKSATGGGTWANG
jgi:hypothetical protein